MTRLTDIIEINISRETAAVAQTNFNVPLFISAHTNFVERARVYSSLDAVADDFATTDAAYIAATKFFSQEIVPASIVLGRRQIPGATINVGSVTVGQTYTVTINDIPYSYTAVTGNTATQIAAGIRTAYMVTPVAGVTMTANGDGTLTVASTVDWSMRVSAGLNQAAQPSTESWATSVEAVQNANDTWYALVIESHVTADVLAVAAVIEAKKKIFGTSSQSADVKTASANDVFSQLKALGYQRTFGIWSATADTEYPEAAWIGYQLQEQPGSNTWAYKGLSGVTVSKLSDTESANILAKSGSTYEAVANLNSTIGAKMFGGEWIDVMVFVDWLEQRMKERMWYRLRNMKKLGMNNAGKTIIESDIRAQLNDGIRVGGLDDSPAPKVTVPPVLSLSPNTRANRVYEGITFEARLAGAIHFIKIRGTVTV